MKITTTIKNFKNNIIGYFNTNKQKNLLEDLNYTYKFLINKSYANSSYIIFNENKSNLKYNMFKTSDSLSLNNDKGLSNLGQFYASIAPPQDNILEIVKTSNLLDSYDTVYIYISVAGKANGSPFKYRYKGKDAIEFKLDSYGVNDSIVTIVFVYKDILYLAERRYIRTNNTYEYSNEFDEWFDNNSKE